MKLVQIGKSLDFEQGYIRFHKIRLGLIEKIKNFTIFTVFTGFSQNELGHQSEKEPFLQLNFSSFEIQVTIYPRTLNKKKKKVIIEKISCIYSIFSNYKEFR